MTILTAQALVSVEQNELLVRRFVKALENMDENVFDDVIAPNFRLHSSTRDTSDRVSWKQAAKEGAVIFPDIHLTIEESIAKGDKVVVRLTETGTHTGELFGIAGTGKKVSFSNIIIFRIDGGMIVEAWQNIDVFALMQQLHLIPTPGPE